MAAKARGDANAPDRVYAGQLCGDHIGTLVRFRTRNDVRETVAIHTGELRQLSANGNEVVLRIGLGAEDEHTLDHADVVILRPAEDYIDVALLLGTDPPYAQFILR